MTRRPPRRATRAAAADRPPSPSRTRARPSPPPRLIVVLLAALSALLLPPTAPFAPTPQSRSYGGATTTTPSPSSRSAGTRTSSVASTRIRASVEEDRSDVEVASPPSPPTEAPDDDDAAVAAYATGYRTAFAEVPCSVLPPSSGSLPPDLVGTYYRCGPAMFSAGSLVPPETSTVKPKSGPVGDGEDAERMVKHPFEGDGAVLAVTFGYKGESEGGGEGDGSGDGDGDGGGGGGGTGRRGAGTCAARFRYVRTNAFANERKRGARMYTGMDSTRSMGPSAAASGLGNDVPLPLFRHHLQPGLNRRRKNTSNTRAVYWGKKLLTLWEGGLPYKLDALALSTEGRSQLGGVLKESDPFGAGRAYDSASDRMLFYSNLQGGGGRSTLRVYEFDSEFRPAPELGGKVEADLPGFAVLSDMAVTENYAVFIQPPVAADGIQMMLSKEPGKTLRLEEGAPATLHLIPRVGAAGVKSARAIDVPPDDAASDANVQFINAYETDGGDTVVIDAIRSDPSRIAGEALPWPWATNEARYAAAATRKSLWRYTARLGDGSVKKERLSDLRACFGTVNPAVSGREHRYVYAAVGGVGSEAAPPRGVAKFDVKAGTADVWMPEPHQFCGEPAYAPRTVDGIALGVGVDLPEEDDGYLLTVLYDGDEGESELVVLRCADVSSGPAARVRLGLAVPHGLHGCFAPGYGAAWGAEEIARRAKLADKMEGRGAMWNEVKSDFSGLGLRLDDIEEYFGDVF